MNLITIKTALKNLLDRRNSSLISVAGLTIAFIAIFYIYSHVAFELGYDSHHENASRVFRISGEIVTGDNVAKHAVLGPFMGRGLKEHFPAVREFARLVPIQRSIILERENSKFSIEEAYYVDHSVFDLFTFEFIHGDRSSALVNPREIVLNLSLSSKMFGDENPLGKTIRDGDNLLTVTGVIKDSPGNSHHKLNVLFSHPNPDFYPENEPAVRVSEGYWMPSAYHFIMLEPGTGIESVTGNFESFYDRYMSPFGDAINATFNPVAIPLRDLHFSPHMSYDYPKGNMMYNYFMIIVALFILLIATINYTNLLVSQNISRSKSTGIMKVIGAKNSGLFLQAFINSLVYILFSLVLAGLLFRISLPYSASFTGFDIADYPARQLIVFSFVLLLVTAFFTSLIPFLGLAGRSGLELIRPWQDPVNKGILRFGKLSTILQYALTTILIISAIFISRQIYFLVDCDMGFDKENVVLVRLSDRSAEIQSIGSFREELLRNPSVQAVAYSTNVPGEVLGTFHFPIDQDGQRVTKIVKALGIDYDFIPLMGMELLGGRNFDESFSDGNFNSAIANEACVEFLGLSGDITGLQIENTTVVGVLKDVSFNSLHNPADPIVFYLTNEPAGYLNIKLGTPGIRETLDYIRATWVEVFGDAPFEYQFLDSRVAMMYAEEERTGKLVRGFTIVSILLSLMGLVNLSSLIMKRKTKEIGIRKVNGAKIWEVMAMLNLDFVKSVVIAFVLATPVAWYAMNKWLQNFAYRTELSWWIFALAGVIALGIALLTVSWQSWRAARRNPVEALRYE